MPAARNFWRLLSLGLVAALLTTAFVGESALARERDRGSRGGKYRDGTLIYFDDIGGRRAAQEHGAVRILLLRAESELNFGSVDIKATYTEDAGITRIGRSLDRYDDRTLRRIARRGLCEEQICLVYIDTYSYALKTRTRESKGGGNVVEFMLRRIEDGSLEERMSRRNQEVCWSLEIADSIGYDTAVIYTQVPLGRDGDDGDDDRDGEPDGDDITHGRKKRDKCIEGC